MSTLPSSQVASTKDRILKDAATLFARNGYHGTGIAEVCEAVGLGRGALYYHIGSKDVLLFEISMSQVLPLVEHAEGVLASAQPPAAQLRALARELLRNMTEHLAEWTVFFREFYALDGDHLEQTLAARQRYEECWRAVINSGVESGIFQPGSPVRVKGILGLFNYSYLWLRDDGALTAEEIADEFIDLVLWGISSQPEATEQ